MSAKVRIACRRCRTKRIKCDGGIPACGNCQKAAEPCIDVDGRNNSLFIPRDFAASARARIEWLEQQIKLLSPTFELEDGPRVDFGFLYAKGLSGMHAAPSPGCRNVAPSPEGSRPPCKRNHDSAAANASSGAFPDEARSVALDLGLLTLNCDSRQTHYLGTSSGRLFTRLIGAGFPDAAAGAGSYRPPGSFPLQGSSKSGLYAHTKPFKESCQLLYDNLKKSLPTKEDARLLLEVYFRNIHVDHPILHPRSLLLAVEALYQCAAADATTEIGHNGWPASVQPFAYNGEHERSRHADCTPITVFTATFHVFMVFTLAAIVRTRQRAYDFAPNHFHRVAMTADQHCFSSISLASLQATLLLVVHSLLRPTELNIWTLTYVSMAHCVDLGLHRSISDERGLSHATILTRKLLFFSVYHLDRSVASIQGRPLGIRDETFDLQLPTLADIEIDAANISNMAFSPVLSPTSGTVYAIHRFKLDPIISEIKLLFYHLPSRVSTLVRPSNEQISQATIVQKLQDWREMLDSIAPPSQIDYEVRLEHDKYRLKLLSQFYAAMVLLHQPSQAISQPSEQAILTCYECSAKRLDIYHSLSQLGSHCQSWRGVQGIFSSGATMIYCLRSSSLVRRTVPAYAAMRDLRTCTNLLSVGGEFWPSVKKGMESLSRAVDALARKLDQFPHEENQHHGSRGPPHISGCHDRSSIVMQDEHVCCPPSDQPHLFVQEQEEHTESCPSTSDVAISNWPNFGDPTFAHDPAHQCGAMFGASQQATDATVEAFIAEFLSNDTAWNPV